MNWKDIIFFGILVACLLGLAGVLQYMRAEGGACLKNPFVYGAVNLGEVECKCTQSVNPKCPAVFSFNDTGFESEVTTCKVDDGRFDVDIGSLNLTVEK